MDFLTSLLENSNAPVLSALLLGLMTAISPCPLATNISAIGYISKDLESRSRVFVNGLVYTLGRSLSYTGLAGVLLLGANRMKFSLAFQQYGEKALGPLLIVIGLLMLGIITIRLPGFDRLSSQFEKKKSRFRYWDVLLLGVVFALAFCPYSGVLYFGMLIPMTLGSDTGLLLPVLFALATGIPVILFAWLLAYSVAGVGRLYQNIKAFEVWFRRVVAVLFIAIGLYYIADKNLHLLP
jgi:cytochrome c-type biogenesis protein